MTHIVTINLLKGRREQMEELPRRFRDGLRDTPAIIAACYFYFIVQSQARNFPTQYHVFTA